MKLSNTNLEAVIRGNSKFALSLNKPKTKREEIVYIKHQRKQFK